MLSKMMSLVCGRGYGAGTGEWKDGFDESTLLATEVHNVFHMSRLKPFHGDHSEGEPLEGFEVPKETRPTSDKSAADSAGKVYEVERIIGHRGKKGDAGHKYLVKWRYYSPFYSSWEPASQVDAPRVVEKYEADLKRQRDYLDGVIQDLGDDIDESEQIRLDPEAYNSVDAIVCAQLCEMDEKWQDWVASKWLDRTYFSDPSGDEV